MVVGRNMGIYNLIMPRALITLLFLLAGYFQSVGTPLEAQLKDLSLGQLKKRLADIDSELGQLALPSPRGGVGSSGYRTRIQSKPDTSMTIRIELGEEAVIDEVVIVPTLYRDSERGLRSGGFPVTFRILVGTDDSSKEVASFSAEDHLLPRIAPLAVPFDPINASWVSIEVSTLSATPGTTNQHTLQLSEILVFSGKENVALPQRAGTNAEIFDPLSSLADGFTPFLMNAAQGSSSQSRPIRILSETFPQTLTIDLNESQPVHQINLHTADMTLSVPMTQFSCWAVPRHIRVVGANQPDFSDETFLCEYEQKSIYGNGPIIIRRFPETLCRYIRLEIIDPRPIVSINENLRFFAFSEIEVFSNNQNIAQGAAVVVSSGLKCNEDSLGRLTDGLNYYGAILPIRDWVKQLSRRHDLEVERPLVVAELSLRHVAQQTKLRRMIWLAASLGAIIVIGFLIERLFYLKKMEKMRTRFAADLHDELGANLHTIALLSDAATAAHDSEEEWQMLHRRIRRVTARTGIAIRHFSHIVNADGLYRGLVEDMEKVSRRILAKIDYSIDISGEEYLEHLKVHSQVDLFLFYKESLVNICRHSDATRVSTQLKGTAREVILTISDNGKGLSKENIPASLKRRARLLKAKLSVEENSEGGTSVSVRLITRKGFWHDKSKASIHEPLKIKK